LREDVADRAGERLVALARAGGRRIDDIVEQELAVIERFGSTGQLHWAASELPIQRVERV